VRVGSANVRVVAVSVTEEYSCESCSVIVVVVTPYCNKNSKLKDL
jgi:hypothetical protein